MVSLWVGSDVTVTRCKQTRRGPMSSGPVVMSHVIKDGGGHYLWRSRDANKYGGNLILADIVAPNLTLTPIFKQETSHVYNSGRPCLRRSRDVNKR
jgi:hypothetical protein